MSAAEPAKEKLRQAIESLRSDIDRVEFWADALERLDATGPRISGHRSPFTAPVAIGVGSAERNH